ncbi:MAG: DUF115 domain-containing protein [Chlamydiae bacterium]|nr:DUF115 domain-containing protein [Chlamydiota bacterium]
MAVCEISVKDKNISLLYEKYPEIAFQYSCMEFTPNSFPFEEEDMAQWRGTLSLEGIDTLYVYGTGRGVYYEALAPWLKEKKERALIFIESQMSEIDHLLCEERSSALLHDPQVSLHFADSKEMLDAVLEECVSAFPTDRVEFVASIPYQKKYAKKVASLKLSLLRKSALVHSLLSEALHYHVLTQNLVANFSHIAGSSHVNALAGAFKNIPAIICGAGPSLAKVTEELQGLSSHALIFGGGSAITALASQGVPAHIAMAIDPNYEEYSRLKNSQGFEVPFFYASRIHPGVFDAISAPLGYMSTDTGGTLETWVEEKLSLSLPHIGRDLSAEALSITTIAVSLAQMMGCSPIIFCGVDLAYTGMKRYSDGVMAGSSVTSSSLKKEMGAMEKLLIRKDRKGQKIHTLVKWIMESSCFGAFAKDHPDTPFFNCTDSGLEIPSVPYKDFSELATLLRKNSWDLRGMLHAKMQETLIVPTIALSELKEELLKSLKSVKTLIEDILHEVEELQNHIGDPTYPLISARRSVFEMDLEEEISFKVLISLAPIALERLLTRKFWSNAEESSLEYRRCVAEKELAKWKQMLHITNFVQKTLS